MSGRYFLDTNVLAYCFDPRAPAKQSVANRIVREGLEKRTAVISYQIVQEFINVALKKFEPRLDVPDLQQYVNAVLRPMLAISSSVALCDHALEIWQRYRIGWYDSLMVAAAVESGCDVLYSEDFQHKQQIETVRIVNPFL